jgi:hypothetical protein
LVTFSHPSSVQEDRKLDALDEECPEFGESVEVPDLEALSERLHSCLQESEELPADFTQLFDDSLFKFDTALIPEAIESFKVCFVSTLLVQLLSGCIEIIFT